MKIRLTKCGLTFSGPTAFPWNMNRADFVFDSKPYSSSEQGIQYLNAMHQKVPEIAGKILATHETKIIKDFSHDIPKSDEWKKLAATKLWDLMDAKFPVTIIPPTFQSKPGLKFVHINCRSLFKNFEQIVENFKYCDIV